jgi:anti-sigma B factor antagonist
MTWPRLWVPTTVAHEEDVTIITLDGDGVVGHVNPFVKELQGITDERSPHHLALDLCNVTQINGEGLGILILLHKQMVDAGGKLTLHNVHPHLNGVFAVTKLDTIFDIH